MSAIKSVLLFRAALTGAAVAIIVLVVSEVVQLALATRGIWHVPVDNSGGLGAVSAGISETSFLIAIVIFVVVTYATFKHESRKVAARK